MRLLRSDTKRDGGIVATGLRPHDDSLQHYVTIGISANFERVALDQVQRIMLKPNRNTPGKYNQKRPNDDIGYATG